MLCEIKYMVHDLNKKKATICLFLGLLLNNVGLIQFPEHLSHSPSGNKALMGVVVR